MMVVVVVVVAAAVIIVAIVLAVIVTVVNNVTGTVILGEGIETNEILITIKVFYLPTDAQ